MSLNDLRDFNARALAFCLIIPFFEKVTKMKADFVLLYTIFFFFFFLYAFYFKVVKTIKTEQYLLKNCQSHDAKNKRSEHFVS